MGGVVKTFTDRQERTEVVGVPFLSKRLVIL